VVLRMSSVNSDHPVAYKHDVFVSYSHSDGDWVKTVLVPQLQQHHLSVLVDDDFEPGATAKENMAKAVMQSHYTVAVVTDDWVHSEWSQFETLLTDGLDPDARERRLIPVMLKKCTPPKHIQERTWVEFVDQSKFAREMDRLVASLTRPAVDRGDLMPALQACRTSFENACEQIARLADFKDVHDQLHQLQLQCYEPMLREAALLGNDDQALSQVELYAIELKRIIDEVRRITSGPCFRDVPCDWIEELQQAHERVTAALAKCDTPAVLRAAKTIDRILALQPASINTRLNEAARQLNFKEVLESIDSVLTNAHLLDINNAEIGELTTTRNAIDQLRENLKTLVRDHDYWQVTDTELRTVEKTLLTDTDQLIDQWPVLRSRISILCDGREWGVPFEKEELDIDAAIESQDAAQMRKHFRLLRRHAVTRFYQVDCMLKKHCDELKRVGEPLSYMVRVLRIQS
jgi:hypothetical protein